MVVGEEGSRGSRGSRKGTPTLTVALPADLRVVKTKIKMGEK